MSLYIVQFTLRLELLFDSFIGRAFSTINSVFFWHARRAQRIGTELREIIGAKYFAEGLLLDSTSDAYFQLFALQKERRQNVSRHSNRTQEGITRQFLPGWGGL